MHKLHLVINKEPLKPEKITEILENEGFTEERETYYIQSSGRGDWFVIGGRWTGILQKPTRGFFEFIDMYKTKPDRQEFWQDNGGLGLNPADRDLYKKDGYEDDQAILDDDLFKHLEKQKNEYDEAIVTVIDTDEDCVETEISYDELLEHKDLYKNYQITVLDVHH